MFTAFALVVLLASAETPSQAHAHRAALAAQRAQLEAQAAREMELRRELDVLAQRIEGQKSRQPPGRVLRSASLEADLRRSQELADALGALTVERAALRAKLESTERALLAALEDDLKAAQEAAASASGEARAPHLERLRSLRAERDALRPSLPAAGATGATAPASDDPRELLEQADALRDAEDKVQARLTAVRTRLEDARSQRLLDQRMSDFLGEEALFDEQDRRLRVVQEGASVRAAADEPGPPVDVRLGAPGGNLGPVRGEPSPTAESGKTEVGIRSSAPEALDEVGALEAEARQLDALSRDLRGRAEALEARARSLE